MLHYHRIPTDQGVLARRRILVYSNLLRRRLPHIDTAARSRCHALILGERVGSVMAGPPGAARLVQPGEELSEQVA